MGVGFVSKGRVQASSNKDLLRLVMGGEGDMKKYVYDPDNDGIIDAANLDASLLQTGDVDDTPVNGATTAPVSSNWAYDHENATAAHGCSEIADVSDIGVDSNLSAAAQDAINKRHSQNTDTGTNSATFSINGANAIVEGDPRLTDSRDPNAHASSHAVGGSDTVFPEAPATKKALFYDPAGNVLIWDDATSGASAFTDLTDTFANYTGLGGQYVKVKATEDGLETGTPSGGGDFMADGSVPLTGDIDFAGTQQCHDLAAPNAAGEAIRQTAKITESSLEDAVDKKHTQGTDTTLGTLTADINFNKYKAIAMVCDNGATVPASPVAGQWFLHTPTGRNILMMYDGSNWIPIISLGTTTIYVDGTNGTDAIDNGGSSGASAVKTVQYAVNLLPGLLSGNVTIYIAAGTDSADVVIRGKTATGNYTITLQGTLTAHLTATQDSAVQGDGSTRGSITDAGEFTGHANDLLYSSNNNEYRLIDTATSDTATIVGYWTATPSGSYTIYQWGSSIQTLTVSGLITVHVNDLSMRRFTYASGASGSITRCKVSTTSSELSSVQSGSSIDLVTSYVGCTQAIDTLLVATGTLSVIGSKIVNSNDNGYCLTTSGQASIFMVTRLSVIDGSAGANKAIFGVFSTGGSMINMAALYHVIRNCDYGVYANYGGQVYYTSNNQYSSNGSNETAVSSSYGYID